MQHRILFVTQTAFHPAYQGDSARVAALVAYFRRAGWYVFVFHLHDRSQVNADYNAMAGLCDGLRVYYPTDADLAARTSGRLDHWCPAPFASAVAETCMRLKIHALVVQFVFLTLCFDRLAPALPTIKILDADNVFTDRAALYRSAKIEYKWFSTDADQERLALRRADLILSIQEDEIIRIRQMAGETPVMLVPHVHDALYLPSPENCNILFVGARNSENVAGLRKFVRSALPEIVASYPQARLLVAGSVGETLESNPAVDSLGVVQDLVSVYERSSIVINTTECGTGLKIKTVDALCHSRCLVSTPTGVAGLERHPEVFFVAESCAAFAQTIAGLFRNRELIATTGQRAFNFSCLYFSPSRVLGALERYILSRVSD